MWARPEALAGRGRASDRSGGRGPRPTDERRAAGTKGAGLVREARRGWEPADDAGEGDRDLWAKGGGGGGVVRQLTDRA